MFRTPAAGFVITFSYAYDSQAKEGVMAQRVEVILEDDIDGSPAGETVRFALNGTSYEIDLSSENALALRSSLGRYIEHARKAPGGPAQAGSRGSALTPPRCGSGPGRTASRSAIAGAFRPR